jgi:hypothetical protein
MRSDEEITMSDALFIEQLKKSGDLIIDCN